MDVLDLYKRKFCWISTELNAWSRNRWHIIRRNVILFHCIQVMHYFLFVGWADWLVGKLTNFEKNREKHAIIQWSGVDRVFLLSGCVIEKRSEFIKSPRWDSNWKEKVIDSLHLLLIRLKKKGKINRAFRIAYTAYRCIVWLCSFKVTRNYSYFSIIEYFMLNLE